MGYNPWSCKELGMTEQLIPMHTQVGYYSAIKMNLILSYAAIQMDFEGITLSEVS